MSSHIQVQPRAPNRRTRSVRPQDPAPVWFCSGRVPSHPNVSRSRDNLVPMWAAGGKEKHWGRVFVCVCVCVCVCVAGGEVKGSQNAPALFSFPPFSRFVESTSPSLQSLLWREGPRKPCSVPVQRAGLAGVLQFPGCY